MSGVQKSADSHSLAIDGIESENISSRVEVIEKETVLETSESGLIMLAHPPDTSHSSASLEQQTAIVVTPVHDDGNNRIQLEYSQPLLDSNRRIQPHGGEIFRVSVTGSSTELRCNRSLEALCNAADSELKNIGHQDEQLVQINNARCSNQVACMMNSVVGSSNRLVLPAIRVESDNVGNSPSEAVLLMQKPDNSYRGAGFYVPVTSNSVSSGISISNSSVEGSYSAAMSKKLPHTMHMMSSSVMQSSQRNAASGAKPSRHTCRFCGRVCAKPSVLQKHIRTHTGERPFPCTTCGLRFKTKSNLYKHCKSRTHRYALSGSESLSADESVPSASGKLASEEEQAENTGDGMGKAASDDKEEQLRSDDCVDQLQMSQTSTDKVSPDAPGAPCKLLTVIDGNMYVMEQVALPSWQQLQQGAAMSFSVPLQTTAASESMQSDQLLHGCHSTVRLAVVPTAQCNLPQLPATSADSESAPQIIRSSATRESLQEHITRLISENASIINTPMAEAPRAKRILRQSSDISASSAAKQTSGRPLLRTRSLTPCPTALPASLQTDTNDSCSSEVSRQKLLQWAASETTAYSSLQDSGSYSTGKQFLTVPNEPHGIKDITNRLMLLPSKSEEDAIGTDAECSEVRIVLELADSSTSMSSAEADVESDASHLPVLSTAVTPQPLPAVDCKTPPSSQSVEHHSPTLLPVTGLVPAFCMIKPVEQSSVSGTGLPLQFAQANPMTQSVPLQCVLLGKSDIAVPVTSHTSSIAHPATSRPVIKEVVNAQQQPRRGRPKGSKNRPKLAAASSDPVSSVTPRTVTVREPMSASVTSAPAADSLWRLKLKDQLMRRSLSAERHASPARQDDKPVSSSCESVSHSVNISAAGSCGSASSSAAAKVSQLLSTSSLGTTSSVAVTAGPVIRSHSCDASVPPKKRRKTLTELGRGTAFGTRVEESAPAVDLQSNKVTDSDSLSLADDSVFDPPQPQSENVSLVSSMGDSTPTKNLFPLTNRALQIMYNSPPRASALCSSAVMHGSDIVADSVKPPSLFIRLPTGVGSKIPGLVRCSGSAQVLDSAAAVSPTLINLNTTDNLACCGDSANVQHHSAAFRGKDAVRIFTHLVSADDNPTVPAVSTVSVTESGKNVACSSVASVDETELFELPFDANASSGTLLLLGHSYPSLGIVAEPTFCSILSTQPTCVERSGESDGHVSMYDTWRTSGSAQVANDKLVLTARETFSLYRTARLGKDLSYAAAPAFDLRTGGVLTHSSYWKYRTDCNGGEQTVTGSVSPTADIGKTVDVLSTSSVISGHSTEINGVSPVGIVAEEIVRSPVHNMPSEVVQSELKVASNRSMDDELSQKRVWIFPGGYRSTESYVYVRGRGRGRYVCATCGVRCKKPSVLRKHLRSHTDVRPHHCNVCDVGFKTKGNLSKHLNSKAHHLRSSELGSSGEQMESCKSLEGSSYDADLDSSCELAHGSSTVDPESDSGCELQPGSSCEVETEAVSVLHPSSSVETDGENHSVDRHLSVSGAETRILTDGNISSRSPHIASYGQKLYVDVSGHNQPLMIATALQQKQALHSKTNAVI